jgi:hypothetical protein
MSEENLTVGGLAERSGLSEPTARRAVRADNTARLNTRSATRIAEAFGSSIDEINWPGGGLTNRGRPGGSGAANTHRSG